MSENENYTSNGLMKKITLIGKNIKTLNDMIKSIDEKLKPVEREQSTEEKEKEKSEKIFESHGLGRPQGSYETKQKKYCEMLNSNKIKQPKQQTLEFYKTTKIMMEYMYYLNN